MKNKSFDILMTSVTLINKNINFEQHTNIEKKLLKASQNRQIHSTSFYFGVYLIHQTKSLSYMMMSVALKS